MNIDYIFTHYDFVNEDGTIKKFNTFKNEMKHFKGTEVEIIVRKKRAKRSLDQNALYRSYVKLLADFTGYSTDEMHSVIGLKFRKREKVDEKTGEIMPYIRSTTSMNKLEMADHITEIRQWSEASLKLRLPKSGESWQITFID